MLGTRFPLAPRPAHSPLQHIKASMPCSPKELELAKQLLSHVHRGNRKGAETALAAGASVDGAKELDYLPILDASAYGNGGMVKFLIKKGCNVNLGAPRAVTTAEGELMMVAGQRALHASIDSYHLEVFRMLLKHGADPNATSDSGVTPLMCACKVRGGESQAKKHLVMARELLEAGADPVLADKTAGRTALHSAAAIGTPELVELVLSKTPPASWNYTDIRGWTALCHAALEGKHAEAKLLLSAGVRQPTSSPAGVECPLATAAHTGHAAIARLLLEDGMNAVGGTRKLPKAIFSAIAFSRASVVQMLISAGGEEQLGHWAGLSYDSRPMLNWASTVAHLPTMSVLLAAGAREDARDSRGRLAFDVIGSDKSVVADMDPSKRAAARRMLQRGPAFRAKSWAWPGSGEASGVGGAGGNAAAAWRGEVQDPLGVRVFRRSDRHVLVRVCGRYSLKM